MGGEGERLPELAAELIRLKCDVILTSGTEAAEAAKNTIKTIPVVMAIPGGCGRRGIVADLARPGGALTGLTSSARAYRQDSLELLKEVVPKLSRVGFLWSPTNPEADHRLKAIEPPARSLRLGDSIHGGERACRLRRGISGRNQKACWSAPGGGRWVLRPFTKRIVDLAARSRLPAMYGNVRYVEAGGVMTYALDRPYQYRRAARVRGSIQKGTKPADLPVERPTKFELVINLKAAEQIGLTIPPNAGESG